MDTRKYILKKNEPQNSCIPLEIQADYLASFTLFIANMDGGDGFCNDDNTTRIIYTYPMARATDMTKAMKAEVRYFDLVLN